MTQTDYSGQDDKGGSDTVVNPRPAEGAAGIEGNTKATSGPKECEEARELINALLAAEERAADAEEKSDNIRILALCALIAASWAAIFFSFKPPSQSDRVEKGSVDAYISPLIKACYSNDSTTTQMIVAGSVGIALGVSYLFGSFLYKLFRYSSRKERRVFWTATGVALIKRPDEIRELASEFREFERVILDRRNIFWSLFARFTLATLVVGLIAELIVSCKIESQAGLPIISGLIAFVIGQGSDMIGVSSASPAINIVVKPQEQRKKLDSNDGE